jgi:hypothetical protein
VVAGLADSTPPAILVGCGGEGGGAGGGGGVDDPKHMANFVLVWLLCYLGVVRRKSVVNN